LLLLLLLLLLRALWESMAAWLSCSTAVQLTVKVAAVWRHHMMAASPQYCIASMYGAAI